MPRFLLLFGTARAATRAATGAACRAAVAASNMILLFRGCCIFPWSLSPRFCSWRHLTRRAWAPSELLNEQLLWAWQRALTSPWLYVETLLPTADAHKLAVSTIVLPLVAPEHFAYQSNSNASVGLPLCQRVVSIGCLSKAFHKQNNRNRWDLSLASLFSVVTAHSSTGLFRPATELVLAV